MLAIIHVHVIDYWHKHAVHVRIYSYCLLSPAQHDSNQQFSGATAIPLPLETSSTMSTEMSAGDKILGM